MNASIVVLTGAGISAESGVPTFRGADGIWGQHRAQDLATPEAFANDPALVWEFYGWRRELVAACKPNPAHEAIAQLENQTDLHVITQNIDGLHQLAGSRNLIELHGNIWHMRCSQDCHRWEDRQVPLKGGLPRCPECGALARPDVVWFGEPLQAGVLTQAAQISRRADLFVVVGTSALVQPAASLPLLSVETGARLIEINTAPTPLTRFADEVYHGPASTMVPRWICEMGYPRAH